ncbi:Bacteriophage Rz lysis protein [Pseudomonas sp. NFR09]|uniref:lysis system i-spanin subunit Rz n=1 Tax=Pseudomonas sp. NFR09 TaxID=1566249 RepID=UPI0008D7A216|nr:lysis system i-spanin subunit Rz [Pseudomonas sp. NFR09]SET26989.1 Bacteriophage Rz lysis protein [Pseudomonas sp. NFR09]
MTPGQILASILLALVIGFGGAWQVQGWRMGEKLAEQDGLHKDDLADIGKAAASQARAEQDKRLAAEQQLSRQDQKHTKELSDEQRKQAVIRDRLATADLRLSVLLKDPASGCDVPTTTAAVGVVHATRRAQLDPAHAQRIIAITADGNNGLIALRACQAYVREISAVH